jgi:cation:H+ antiporter
MSPIIVNLLLLSVSLFLLAIISDKVVQYVVILATFLGLSGMAAGFLLLSISTSLPELFICILSSIRGEAGLLVGNILGANIYNLTIIPGLVILLGRTIIIVEEASQKELVQFLFVASIIPLFIVQRGSLSPALGLVLLTLFAFFIHTTSRKIGPKIKRLQTIKTRNTLLVAIKFLIGIALMIIISRFTVNSAINIANAFDLPPSIIGASIIGLGTTLPELVTAIQSVKKKMFDLALGNLLGSCITNITLILGLSSLITFSRVDVIQAQSLVFFVLLSSMSFWYILSTRLKIGRREALIFILIYILFITQQLGISILIF